MEIAGRPDRRLRSAASEPATVATWAVEIGNGLAAVVASVPEVVTAPVRSPLVIEVAPLNLVRLPEAGDPVVVTVPEPDGVAHVPSPRK